MNGAQLAFLILPALAGVLVAWAARHWALGAAALTGALAWLFLVPSLPGGARFFTPLFTGAGVAGLTLAVMLALRPGINVWTRMTLTLAVTFGAHLLFLFYAMANR